MTRFTMLVVLVLVLLCLCHLSVATIGSSSNKKSTYIVHVAKSQMPESFEDHKHWYDSSLKSVSDSAEMLYVYNNVVHGFSARLTVQEAESLERQSGILSVLPEMKYELHTTRTPSFLGLDRSADFFPESNAMSDVIVGVLDTGVWPESKSFDDTGLGPVPDSWKGECESGTNFSSSNCNRKLIGARYFSKGYETTLGPVDVSKESKSARDDDGHGTHTATTAAGSVVQGASLFGYASGTARGMATRARVAVYKVCWIGGCFSSDILAAMDKAIDDNVNVLSLSLGGGNSDYYRDSVAIGAFAAMEKGILVSCSAGNAGPSPYSLSNVAPWITTVGAGTLDRDFPAYVSLGNGKNFSGVSLYKGDLSLSKMLPFVYAGNASNTTNGNLCMTGTLIPEKVKGKIVLCDRGINPRVQKGSVVKEAGGVGMILANTAANGDELVADAHLLPATTVGQTTGEAIKKYLTSDPNPTATILFEGTKVGIKPSPVVAAFSSRGPNSITQEILKPDIIAPGVNILAGWTGAVGPTGLAEDTRRVGFNIISGTSMSCPHVSGLAALLKGVHPDWSPAAIRSALMTTAYTVYKNGGALQDVSTGKPSTPFDHGAGHVDPVAALNPGLVYDLRADDYLNFLCALNYTSIQINSIARRNYNCETSKKYSVTDLNYPSFAVVFPEQMTAGSGSSSSSVKYTRTLTNVGPAGTYKVSTVFSPSNSVKVSVEPETLVFTRANEQKSYTVTFAAPSTPSTTNMFGRIEWSDGKHVVGSPVAISWT
ncbi:PREDICTED: subtilisin-like protease SBT1.7 [Nicotiana attenuata]|uniref:Subtilisin-like protease sbt1.7 n=1 Tax=Nicotiana attenuata TaxID=49451 RepID=A0A314LCQ4_NICAT|nr:PREDICTED: subtilisin-like protease SBT1.7 [Nicotiana attenuata]OIT39356.1 subtilisin-like protease sbt1.7 [Nicotiana attenuata]